MNKSLLHSMNKITTHIDVEQGEFISLPKDQSDKPTVRDNINGLKFFGKSTQEIEPYPNLYNHDKSIAYYSMVSFTKTDNGFIFEGENEPSYNILAINGLIHTNRYDHLTFYEGKTYTLSFNAKLNTIKNPDNVRIYIRRRDGVSDLYYTIELTETDTRYSITFTQQETTTHEYNFIFYVNGQKGEISNIKICEGTDTVYTPYDKPAALPWAPSDIISIPPEFNLTVCGKNLFNHRNNAIANGSIEIIDDYVRCTGNNADTGDFGFSRGWYRPNNVLAEEYNQPILKAGDVVTISADVRLIEQRNTPGIRIYLYSKSNNGGHTTNQTKSLTLNTWVRVSQSYTITSTWLVGKDDYYPIFTLNGNIVDIKNIAIKYGTDDTYTPYTGNTYPYRLEDLDGNLHELRSLPDGTRDEYDRDNGILIKRVKRVTILSGTDPFNWTYTDASSGYDPTDTLCTASFVDTTISTNGSFVTNTNVYCDIATPGFYAPLDPYLIWLNGSSAQLKVIMTLKKSELASLDNVGLRDWVTAHAPFDIYYALDEPQIIPIKQYGETYDGQVWDKNEKPKSIQYHTNIFTDVGAEMQCEVRKMGSKLKGTYYWATEDGKRVITEDGDYILFEH